jgi:hypothetical protein
MRTFSKYIAALLSTISLLACLLYLPKWPPGSPPERITCAAARVTKDLHTPFILVRYYRLNMAYTAPFVQHSTDADPHSYEVVLHSGYSMEAHKSFVGPTLQGRITLENARVKGYFAELDEETLRRVRADVGVQRVLLHGYVRLFD